MWGGLADWLNNDEGGFSFEEMERGWLGDEEGRMLEFGGVGLRGSMRRGGGGKIGGEDDLDRTTKMETWRSRCPGILARALSRLHFPTAFFLTGIDHRSCYGNESWAFFWALEAFRSWECMGMHGNGNAWVVCGIDSVEIDGMEGLERERGGGHLICPLHLWVGSGLCTVDG